MNYRKLASGKAAIMNMAKVAKEAVADASRKAQEYISEGTQDAKTVVFDIRDSVTSSVKNKLAEEFRKNYPAYVIEHIDKIIVDAASANVETIEISLMDNDSPEQYSVEELLKTVAEGMVDNDVLRTYTSGKLLTGLYDYIVAYYEAQTQLRVMELRHVLYITLITHEEDAEMDEDVEVDSADETEEVETETEE